MPMITTKAVEPCFLLGCAHVHVAPIGEMFGFGTTSSFAKVSPRHDVSINVDDEVDLT